MRETEKESAFLRIPNRPHSSKLTTLICRPTICAPIISLTFHQAGCGRIARARRCPSQGAPYLSRLHFCTFSRSQQVRQGCCCCSSRSPPADTSAPLGLPVVPLGDVPVRVGQLQGRHCQPAAQHGPGPLAHEATSGIGWVK